MISSWVKKLSQHLGKLGFRRLVRLRDRGGVVVGHLDNDNEDESEKGLWEKGSSLAP